MLLLDRSVFLTYDPGHNAAAVRPSGRQLCPGSGPNPSAVSPDLHCHSAHLFDGWEPWNGENEKEIGDAHQ